MARPVPGGFLDRGQEALIVVGEGAGAEGLGADGQPQMSILKGKDECALWRASP